MENEKQFVEIKFLIEEARLHAFQTVNQQLIDLYWKIGKYIFEKIEKAEWGENIVKSLAEYLKNAEPGTKGFSAQNLWRMKQFYESYFKNKKLSPLVREISWTNNLIILSKTNTTEEREFYIKQAISEKYSKRELERQIDTASQVVEDALSRSVSPTLVSKYETQLFDKKLLESKLDEFYSLAEPQAEYWIK